MTGRRSPIQVLHLFGRLTAGGPAYSLLTLIRASAASGDVSHTVATLTPPEASTAAQLEECGAGVRHAATPAALAELVRAADIVHVHFWNNPWLYRALGSGLPAARLLVWSHVSGERAPQVLPAQLLEYADVTVASSAQTQALPGLSHLEYIPDVAGWERLQAGPRNADRSFTVGFVGKLDFSKLHPDFVRLCAGVEVPGVRFIVCGSGSAEATLRRQAVEAGISDRFELRGFVDNVGGALGEMDVFGYPLASDTYAASELSLQEAMYAGVPPVVLGPASLRHVVSHERTGLVAASEREYVEALMHLHERPDTRDRLGAAARADAIARWSPEAVAARWTTVYERLMELPKRARPSYRLPETGAGRFVESLGDAGQDFRAGLAPDDEAAARADERIAESADVMVTADGGILDYRDRYPGDPHLRLWSGLVLHRQGRAAVAAGEFAAAIRLGLDTGRVRSYLARAIETIGEPALSTPPR